MAEVSTCVRNHMGLRAEIIYYLELHRKSLPSHFLEDLSHIRGHYIYTPINQNPAILTVEKK